MFVADSPPCLQKKRGPEGPRLAEKVLADLGYLSLGGLREGVL